MFRTTHKKLRSSYMSQLQAILATDGKTGVTMSTSKYREEMLQQYRKCVDQFSGFVFDTGNVYCNATFDGYLCWMPTPAGKTVSQNCPPGRLSDTSRLAFRRCGKNGLWLDRRNNEESAIGWTNYTPCFPLEVQTLFGKVNDDERDAQTKFEIAQRTRYLEIGGFTISMIALLTSLFIFSYFRSLRNNRTRIHKSLFCAMVMQVLIRLTVYFDQAFIRSQQNYPMVDTDTPKGIENMPLLCVLIYILLEYAISVMFMWMFIEGLYLHNVVTTNALRERISHLVYYAMGWGLPLMVTMIWATMTALHYQGERIKTCWYGYNFSPLYWIMQGPRLAIIMINLMFLLNIMRVLIVKLRRTRSTEIEKVRKAVRAALVLLPLLGITNILNMVEVSLDSSVWKFALWSYTTHFLRSFQGFFIALIYCFLNGEVRQVLRKYYRDYRAMRGDPRCRSSVYHDEHRYLGRRNNISNRDTSAWVQMRNRKWKRKISRQKISRADMEMRYLRTRQMRSCTTEPSFPDSFGDCMSISSQDTARCGGTEIETQADVNMTIISVKQELNITSDNDRSPSSQETVKDIADEPESTDAEPIEVIGTGAIKKVKMVDASGQKRSSVRKPLETDFWADSPKVGAKGKTVATTDTKLDIVPEPLETHFPITSPGSAKKEIEVDTTGEMIGVPEPLCTDMTSMKYGTLKRAKVGRIAITNAPMRPLETELTAENSGAVKKFKAAAIAVTKSTTPSEPLEIELTTSL